MKPVVVILVVLLGLGLFFTLRKKKSEKFQRLPGAWPNGSDMMTLSTPYNPPSWEGDQWVRIGYATSPDTPFNSGDDRLIVFQNLVNRQLYLLRDSEMIYDVQFMSDVQVQPGGMINVEGREYRVN